MKKYLVLSLLLFAVSVKALDSVEPAFKNSTAACVPADVIDCVSSSATALTERLISLFDAFRLGQAEQEGQLFLTDRCKDVFMSCFHGPFVYKPLDENLFPQELRLLIRILNWFLGMPSFLDSVVSIIRAIDWETVSLFVQNSRGFLYQALWLAGRMGYQIISDMVRAVVRASSIVIPLAMVVLSLLVVFWLRYQMNIDVDIRLATALGLLHEKTFGSVTSNVPQLGDLVLDYLGKNID
jgi:hypothetical protein